MKPGRGMGEVPHAGHPGAVPEIHSLPFVSCGPVNDRGAQAASNDRCVLSRSWRPDVQSQYHWAEIKAWADCTHALISADCT